MASLFDAFDFFPDLEGAAFGIPEGAASVGFEFPSFDFDVPDFSQFDLEGAAFGGQPAPFDPSGFFFDTTSQDLVSPTGERTALADILRGGPGGPGREIAPMQAGAGAGVSGTEPPGLFERRGVLGEGGPVFGSPLGRAAVTGALGLGGLGLSRLLAGESPRLQLPTPRVSTGIQAGEQAVGEALALGGRESLRGATQQAFAGQHLTAAQLADRALREGQAEAEQAPGQRDIRLGAQGMIPGLMQPTAVGTFEDPIEAALRSQLLSVLQGEGQGDPTQEARRQRERSAFENQMFRQLGPDWRLTTPGIQAQQQLEQRQNQERYGERETMIQARLPAQQGRQQFQYLAPVQRAQGLEGIRRPALQDTERLSEFGIRGVPETLTGLRSIAPTSAFISPEGAQRAADIGTSLEAQQALTAFQTRTQQQRELAQGISGLFGQVAGAATQRRSPLEDYFSRLVAQGA